MIGVPASESAFKEFRLEEPKFYILVLHDFIELLGHLINLLLFFSFTLLLILLLLNIKLFLLLDLLQFLVNPLPEFLSHETIVQTVLKSKSWVD